MEGIVSAYKIPDEFANDKALFDYWWLPETRWDDYKGFVVTREARISDEAKAQRLAVPPKHNLITTAGITQMLNNQAVANQSQQQPISQILSIGNGPIKGVTRADTAVAGDNWIFGGRKPPNSLSHVGFLITVFTNLGTGDAVGTWTNIGFYGGGSATTTTGSGVLMSHVLFPLGKGSVAYTVAYSWLMSN